jgi:hypothetical protein
LTLFHTRQPFVDATVLVFAIREMLSSGELQKSVTLFGTGQPVSVEIRQEGPIAYLETTTQDVVFEQDENRLLGLRRTRVVSRRLASCVAKLAMPLGEVLGRKESSFCRTSTVQPSVCSNRLTFESRTPNTSQFPQRRWRLVALSFNSWAASELLHYCVSFESHGRLFDFAQVQTNRS